MRRTNSTIEALKGRSLRGFRELSTLIRPTVAWLIVIPMIKRRSSLSFHHQWMQKVDSLSSESGDVSIGHWDAEEHSFSGPGPTVTVLIGWDSFSLRKESQLKDSPGRLPCVFKGGVCVLILNQRWHHSLEKWFWTIKKDKLSIPQLGNSVPPQFMLQVPTDFSQWQTWKCNPKNHFFH